LLALGSSPELGNDHAINRLTGGLRLTTRSITTNLSLDTTTKDAIGWIDAATERQITLPPASVGRTFVLPFVGPTTPTLRRLGSELINGVASHYAMEGDAQGGLTIAVSDGVNWVARTIRATVSGATSLAGDVIGDTDETVIATITGVAGSVAVVADEFDFNGEASINVGDEADGALEVRHLGTRVVFAHASTPEFGTSTGLSRMIGGLRLTVRDVDGAIDETTTDAICWIDTTGEGSSAILPPATAGRTLILPFVGPESATLQRAGSELINGVAGDYALEGDANGGLAIAVCDGVNWVARVIRDVSTGLTLFGDVTGDTFDNEIHTITGLDGDVTVTAGVFTFPSSTLSVATSEGGDGALEIRHFGNRTAFFHSGTPEFGFAGGLMWLRGGLRFSSQGIFANTALDATAGSAIAFVGGAYQVTLPSPSAGRTLILPISSVSAPTLKRKASETINGVAADYTMSGDASGGIALAVCDGTNWVARVVSAATGGGVPTTRTISTTAPLTGGGDLSANRTLAVSDATTLATGVIQLAGNLAGTAALPAVTGMKADTFSFVTAASVAKGSWTTQGLRIGDGTAPTSPNKLEVLGQAQFGSAAAKVTVGGLTGSETTIAAIWMGTASLSTSNYALLYDTSNQRTSINGIGTVAFRIGGVDKGNWNTNGLRIGDTTTATEKLEVAGNVLAVAATAKITSRTSNTVFDMATADPCFVAESTAASGNAIVMGIVNSIRRGGIRWDSAGNCAYNAVGSHHFFNGLGVGTACGNFSANGLRVAADTNAASKRLEVAGDCALGKTDNTSLHTLYGGLIESQIWTNANLTVDTSVYHRNIHVDSTSAAINITLPSVTGNTGRIITVKRTSGTNNVNVLRAGTALIEAPTFINAKLITDGGGSNINPYVTLQCDGTNWKIMRHFSCQLATS
jgi:hypothetical protein